MRSKWPASSGRLLVSLLAIALVHTLATLIVVQVAAEEAAVAPAAASPAAAAAAKIEKPAEVAPAPKVEAAPVPEEKEPGERKGRADEPKAAKPEEKKPEEKKEAAKGATAQTAAGPKSKTPAAAKSKLPANLGTVTSTGSGGATHYMSKHDAYSAIAEKHGALAHEAMRKSDKRHSSSGSSGSSHHSSALQPFGIHKAGGGPIGDLLSPFRGVADNGLARTLGASMRSIMKSKYSVPAYVASALLGAVALLAFYESPISPLPVPPLPEPPVGRFPPEMPVISPNTQVPFRASQQQQQQQQAYSNQRSAQFMGPQVLFPGQQQQQQRSAANLAAPVQQLAANLVANLGGKQQAAQRKSSTADGYFVGGPLGPASSGRQPLFAAPAAAKQSSSILSFFGLGGSSSSAQAPATGADLATGASSPQIGAVGQAAGPLDGGKPQSSSGPGLSNSHLVNKVKSYFGRNQQVGPMSSPAGTATGASAGNQNPYDQYQRMSFVQALMKDTAFLPGFLSPSRKSSASSPKMAASQPAAASRMALGDQMPLGQLAPAINLPAAAGKQQASQKPASSFGLVRTADRIAHALLDTFTSSIAQRSVDAAISAAQDNLSARRPLEGEDSASSLASATTSLLSDIMSSYQHQQPQAASTSDYQQSTNSAAPAANSAESAQVSVNSRSDGSQEDKAPVQSQQQSLQQATSAANPQQQQQQQQHQQQPTKQQSSVQEQGHVRKTRSIGFEYPIESQSQLAVREQQPAGPSKAAQINNVIDFVADNSVLFKFVMNQVGLSQAVPYVEYVEQILSPEHHQHH